jgi:hypothetical protein
MIRQPTIVAFTLAFGLGFSLFMVKYDVQSLEEQLVKTERQAAADQDAIHVLNAEWSFLTQPERLAELADRHLALHPLTANQLGDFERLAARPERPDGPQIAAADKDTSDKNATERDVSVDSVLKAMQLADYRPDTGLRPGPAKHGGTQ